MRGKAEGLYLYTRHSKDCRYHTNTDVDRDQSRRCSCVKYIRGTALDGARLRQSTGTTSWEKARALLARAMAAHDPLNRPLFGLATPVTGDATEHQHKTVAEAVEQFIDTKRGENIVDISHYIGFFQGELLAWCKLRGIYLLEELNLEQITKFRNSLKNKATVKNRKVSRLRNFFQFGCDRRWIAENPARRLKPAQEEEPEVEYFHPEEMQVLEESCFVSHSWQRGRDFAHRDKRLRAFILFARWTGLAIIDCVRFERDRLQQTADGIWTVMLHRTKNGNPVFVAIPPEVADAVLLIPPLCDRYFFWSGNGKPTTAVRGWRRSMGLVFKAANLKRNGRRLRCHPHMLRHTFAIEKLLGGAALEDVSLLLGHSSIKVTERHYLKFDQRRQERLTRASMVDWEQIAPKQRKPKVATMARAAGPEVAD